MEGNEDGKARAHAEKGLGHPKEFGFYPADREGDSQVQNQEDMW